MTIALRPYQFTLEGNVSAAWGAGAKVVVMRLDTGGGKTAIFCDLVSRHVGAAAIIAHRDNIVSAISLTLARYGIRHNIIASKETCDAVAALHVKKFGRSFYAPGERVAVASVDTLVRRKGLEAWAAQVTLWIVDEGHHLILDNKWDRAIKLFTNPHVRGLLPTATPRRPDGRGLGDLARGGDGVAQVMVEGPPMRWLIDEGYLCDYEIICADSHLTELLGEVGKSGDWSTAQLKAAADQSPIVGDVVETYRRLLAGYWADRGIPASNHKTGLVFASDIDTANKMLQAYRTAGYRAELVTGETDGGVRFRVFEMLEAYQIDVVIAVDIISEGTDIPAVEVGIFGRSTASLIVYMQQLGRTLRPLDTPEYRAAVTREQRLAAIANSRKPYAIIIDHVGNFLRHGPPDRQRNWSLESTSRRSMSEGGVAWRACLNLACGQPYERFRTCCPYCGEIPPEPAGRSSPAMVAGDMTLLDADVLKRLRGEAEEAVMSIEDYRAKLTATGLPGRFIMANVKHHDAKVTAQQALREIMAWWGGRYHAAGLNDREIQRLFFERFDIDVWSAQGLGAADANELMERVALDVTVI